MARSRTRARDSWSRDHTEPYPHLWNEQYQAGSWTDTVHSTSVDRAQCDLGSNYLEHESWNEPCVSLNLGIHSRVDVIYSILLKKLWQFIQVFIGKPGPAFADSSEYIVALVVSGKKQGAVCSSSPSPASERSHNS